MADRELELRLKVDRQQAAQAAQAELQDLTKVRDAHRQADADKSRGSKRAAEDARRESKQSTDAQVRDIHRIRDERGRFIAGAIRENRRLAEEGGRDWSRLGGSIDKAGGLLKSYVGQMIGVSSMQQVVGALADEWARLNRAQAEAGQRVTERRDSIRQLAALKGQAGDTLKTEQQLIELRQKTLQTRDEALAFQFSMVGTGDPLMKEGRIAPDQFTKLSEQVGAWQAMTGYSADQTGAFAGMLPMMMKARPDAPLQADDAFRRFVQVNDMLQMSGADAGTLMESLKKDVSLLESGAFTSLQEQAAVYGAMGTLKGGETGTSVNQLVRATMGSLGRMRGSAIMEGLTEDEIQKRGEYLEGIGARPAMTAMEIADKVSADITAREARAREGGEKFDVRTYLQSQGYGGNIQDIDALLSYRAVQSTLKSTYLPLADRLPTLDQATAPIARFQQFDPLAQRRRAGVGAEAADVSVGAGGPEYAEQLRRTVFEITREDFARRGTQLGDYEGYLKGGLGGLGRLSSLDVEASKFLNRQLPEEQRINLDNITLGPAARASRLAELGRRVDLRGGDSMPDITALVEASRKTTEAIDRQTALIEDQQKRQGPGGHPPPPAQRPSGQGGGGPLRP